MRLQHNGICETCQQPYNNRKKKRFCSWKCRQDVTALHKLNEMMGNIPADGSCMEWPLGKRGGYGRVTVLGVRRTVTHVAFEMACGPIPDGMFVCHKCDNPPCFRPDHLFLGTKLDNARDREAKGRNRPPKGESNPNAKLTECQVREIRRLREAGRTLKSLAAQFGVTFCVIHVIVKRRGWAHVV